MSLPDRSWWDTDTRKIYLFSIKPPVLRDQPTEQQNFCLQTLHSRYSWEDAKKMVLWWKPMKLCNQISQGNAHYCALFGLFIFFPLFLFCLSFNGKLCCLIWGLLISAFECTVSFDTHTLRADSKCSFHWQRMTWQLISEGSNHWGSILSSLRQTALSKATFFWESLNGKWRKGILESGSEKIQA